MILEIEEITDLKPFDAAASVREMIASISPEMLDELADKVASILLKRIETREIEADLPKTLAESLAAGVSSARQTEHGGTSDIDEARKNPDD